MLLGKSRIPTRSRFIQFWSKIRLALILHQLIQVLCSSNEPMIHHKWVFLPSSVASVVILSVVEFLNEHSWYSLPRWRWGCPRNKEHDVSLERRYKQLSGSMKCRIWVGSPCLYWFRRRSRLAMIFLFEQKEISYTHWQRARILLRSKVLIMSVDDGYRTRGFVEKSGRGIWTTGPRVTDMM